MKDCGTLVLNDRSACLENREIRGRRSPSPFQDERRHFRFNTHIKRATGSLTAVFVKVVDTFDGTGKVSGTFLGVFELSL